jgi:signal transduction histidine kinase
MMERVGAALDAEACSVMLIDETGDALRWEVALGERSDALKTMTVALGEGIAGSVAATGQPVLIADAPSDPRWTGARFDAATGFKTRSILCVPIRTTEKIIGVVQVLNRRTGPFTAADQRLLEAIAGIGAVAIENARLYATLEEKVAQRTAELSRTLDELRTAQAQLVQSEKMAALGNLVAGVAHEINTPLGALMNNADLVRRALGKVSDALAGTIEPAQAQRYLEKAGALAEISREAGGRIDAIVRSLRTFSRLDEAERKPADLREGLESTLPLVGHLVKDRVTIVRDYAELPAIECYPNQLNQVFLNLLVNAAQAIEGAGEIRVTTRRDGADAVVEIADSGCGIAPENLARIFDPGFTTKGVGVGTGLGLAICYRIVAAHGGRIEAESEPGRGAKFRVTLPMEPKA